MKTKKPELTPSKKYKNGYYELKNPDKYIGDPNNVIYRSGLEFRYIKYFDEHNDIIQWSSEEIVVPYACNVRKDPRTGGPSIHRYYPDFLVKTRGGKVVMIEIKPSSQLVKPIKKKNQSQKKFLIEAMEWEINNAKWNAAKKYCEERGWIFIKASEKEIKNKWQ